MMKWYKFAPALCLIYTSASYSAEQVVTVNLLVNNGTETILRLRGYDAAETEGGAATDELCPIYTFDRDTTEEPTYEGSDFPYIKVSGEISWRQLGDTKFEVDTSIFSKSSEDHLLINGKPLYRYKECPADPFSLPLKEIEMTGSSNWEKGQFYALKHDGRSWRSVYTPVVAHAVPNEATEKLIADRFNDPTYGSGENQGFAAASTLSDADVGRYHAFFSDIKQVFGAYRNWNTVVLDPDGSDEENAPVFRLLEDIGFSNWDEDITQNGWTTQKAVEKSSCLTGSDPNGFPLEAKSNYVKHSLCILWTWNFIKEDVFFDQFPPLPEGEYYHQWLNDVRLWDGLYHEHYHHYQIVHGLDRVTGFDNTNFDFPEQSVLAPWWWLEGAGQFFAWYARDHWREIDHLAYLDPDNPEYEGYWETLDWSIPAPNSGNNYASLDDHFQWTIDQLNSSFFFAASQVQDTPNKSMGLGNAVVAEGENCKDWEASPEDGWYAGDYRRSYEGQGSCTDIIFAAGTQFIAHKSSWQVALRDIPADYYELGFWGSIEKHLGLTELEFYAEFNALLRSVDANTIDETYAPAGWKIPEKEMAEVVDFKGINYFGKITDSAPPTSTDDTPPTSTDNTPPNLFNRLLDSVQGLLATDSPSAALNENAITTNTETRLPAPAIKPFNPATTTLETDLVDSAIDSNTTSQTLFTNLLQSVIGQHTSTPVKIVMPEASAEFIDPEIWRVFAASDVEQDIVDENLRHSQEAYAVWMADPYYGKKQAKAIYLIVYGTDDEAGRQANLGYCNHIRETGFREILNCGESDHLTYVQGGGSISSNGPLTGYYKLNLSTRGHGASRSMAFHELFHIYQLSNVFTAFDQVQLKSKMGKRSGDDLNVDVAWWMEGNADFFAALYSGDIDQFRWAMRDALEGYGPFSQPRKAQYFEKAEKLYNLSWDQGDIVDLGYRIGGWFVAYLAAEHGEERIYQFWETVDKDGFSETFTRLFGKDYKTYTEEFDVWLQQPNDELYLILDPLFINRVN